MPPLLKTRPTENFHRLQLTLLIGATALYLAFFADNAFQIDDPLFLWAAKQIQNNPADFYGFPVNWSGQVEPMSGVTQNPPLTSYIIALAASVVGWGEVPLHLVFLLAPLAVLIGAYRLAQDFCSQPPLAVLLTLSTPIFLVNANSLMCDMPMTALWVWSVVFWVRGIKEENALLLLVASVLMSLAFLTKYFGFALIPLLSAYSLAHRRRMGREQIFFLIPLLVICGYEWLTAGLYGKGHFLGALAYSKSSNVATGHSLELKTLMGLSFTGGCFASVMFFAPKLLPRKILAGLVLFIALMVPSILYSDIPHQYPFPQVDEVLLPTTIQFAVFMAGGVVLLHMTLSDLWLRRDADAVLLFLWIIGTFFFATYLNWAIKARTLLPMLPAASILLVRRMEQSGLFAETRKAFSAFWPLIPALALALLVSWSDYKDANAERGDAIWLVENYGRRSHTLWFMGHWGFQYYMEALGGKALILNESPIKNGDIMVVPKYNILDRNFTVPAEHIEWKDEVDRPAPSWLAVMNFSLGAGFYSDSWGPLPFAFGKVPPYHFTVIKLKLP